MSAIQVWEGADRVLVVYRKLKWHLLPPLVLWYMFACLARADVDAESRCAGIVRRHPWRGCKHLSYRLADRRSACNPSRLVGRDAIHYDAKEGTCWVRTLKKSRAWRRHSSL
jgi:hypothetical protein